MSTTLAAAKLCDRSGITMFWLRTTRQPQWRLLDAVLLQLEGRLHRRLSSAVHLPPGR